MPYWLAGSIQVAAMPPLFVVVHLIAHGFNELGDLVPFLLFPDADADESNVLVRLGKLGDVGHGLDAGSAPSSPELYDVDLLGIELLNRSALQPLLDLERGRF
jgi:hypothetical protein